MGCESDANSHVESLLALFMYVLGDLACGNAFFAFQGGREAGRRGGSGPGYGIVKVLGEYVVCMVAGFRYGVKGGGRVGSRVSGIGNRRGGECFGTAVTEAI